MPTDRPIYRPDDSGPWKMGRRTLVGTLIGAVVGVAVLAWFGLVLGAACGFGIGLLLDNRSAQG
ncbi:hypothetical protein [Oerskovia flava]|uniref:hypothetical protein n=1 Tax=Oerskovia flava TaxID=2986422 RepID=UPI0022409CB5|nr:hypothetical protein [Oerskovia sp. JB1-3-2]